MRMEYPKFKMQKNEINSNIEKLALSKAEFNVRKHDALREINEHKKKLIRWKVNGLF